MLCAYLGKTPAQDASVTHAYLQQLAREWEVLQQAMLREDFAAMAALLGFHAVDLRFTDWKAWAGVFGLALFEHDYFFHAFRQPLAGDYVDHAYDELGSDDELAVDCYRYKENGAWGVHRLTAAEAFIVLQPEWDRVLRAGEQEEALVWVRRDRRFGLAAVAGEHAGRLLVEPSLDEVGDFNDGLAVARRGTKMGFLARDGSWHAEPAWDEVCPYANHHAVVRLAGKFGFIDASGKTVIAPQFDEADDFTDRGVARVRQGKHCGLVRTDGSVALPVDCERLEWSEDFAGWLCLRDGARVLAHADGRIWLDAGWDAIEVCVAQHTIRVVRNGRVGLLRWCGASLLACEFSAIESMEPHFVVGQALITPDLVRVVSLPGAAQPRVGVWDIRQQCYVVPCKYDFIWITLLGKDDAYGFIVATRNAKRGESTKGRYCVGMLRADGSTLIAHDYAWIGERTALNKTGAMDDIRNTIHFEWARGEPVLASIKKNGPLVWLHA
jgi:hypothetical protein